SRPVAGVHGSARIATASTSSPRPIAGFDAGPNDCKIGITGSIMLKLSITGGRNNRLQAGYPHIEQI
ncbi:MAG TPA: hypothetical protein VEK55_13555, partial [Xanthobacteraceae bacterium]|nr:hypothetical protein [Xanthobacteraceae bacterium]